MPYSRKPPDCMHGGVPFHGTVVCRSAVQPKDQMPKARKHTKGFNAMGLCAKGPNSKGPNVDVGLLEFRPYHPSLVNKRDPLSSFGHTRDPVHSLRPRIQDERIRIFCGGVRGSLFHGSCVLQGNDTALKTEQRSPTARLLTRSSFSAGASRCAH